MTIPSHTPMTLAGDDAPENPETGGCRVWYNTTIGVTYITHQQRTEIAQGRTDEAFEASVLDPSARFHGSRPSIPYATGTGFNCGNRSYSWSDFERDESRPLYLTPARVSLMGWVVAMSDGGQVARCSGRAFYRPADQ